jgi:hypothetical protein
LAARRVDARGQRRFSLVFKPLLAQSVEYLLASDDIGNGP